MILLLGFAFLAGIVTILSPCILPILPVILGSAAGSGKKRAFGIVTGFVLSFTFFTLFLSAIVRSTGISAGSLRWASVVIIGLFGISMWVPEVQAGIERWFSKFSSKVKIDSKSDGWFSGVVVGFSLGLVWTPCVGPILASVISLALTGSVSGQGLLITLAYAMGTAIPMFAIIYGGGKLLSSNQWLFKNTKNIQKGFGVLMVLVALAIGLGWDRSFQAYVLDVFPNYGVGLTQFEDNKLVEEELLKLDEDVNSRGESGETMDKLVEKNLNMAPEIIPGGEWVNSEGFTLESLRGKVVLVDFWTYTCINCIRTLPYLVDWYGKYEDSGLVVIGVHTPEFEFEKDVDNVKQAVEDFGIKYPVVQDNNFSTWRAYSNRYWPAKYLIDHEGRIVYTHFGEGKYDETEKEIQKALENAGKSVDDMTISNIEYSVYSKTPELYLGHLRMSYLDPSQKMVKDQAFNYVSPEGINRNSFSFSGVWEINDEYSLASKGSKLTLRYSSKDVFLVMRSVDGEDSRVKVSLDGKVVGGEAGSDVVDGEVVVSNDRLYRLVENNVAGEHELELEFIDGEVEVFAFTFG